MFDLIDNFLSKKQQDGLNAPSHVLKKNLNSNNNLHMCKHLTAILATETSQATHSEAT